MPDDLLPIRNARYLPPEQLEYLRQAYEETHNPLYLWEAIFRSTRPDAGVVRTGLPEWCMFYLAELATRLFLLSRGVDFRDLGRFSTDANGRRSCVKLFRGASARQAVQALGEALNLTSENKNWFERLNVEVGLDAKLAMYEMLIGMGKSPKQAREVFIKTIRTREEPGGGLVFVGDSENLTGYEDDLSVKHMLAAARHGRRRQRSLRGVPEIEPN